MNNCYDIILDYIKEKDVLDIGSCAEQGGVYKPMLLFNKIKKRANSVVGIDIESNNNEIIKGNAENINLNQKFDVVTAGDVIEHLDNAGLFLDNMHRHLKDDGAMIIVTPNAKSIGYLPFKGNDFHTCWYCKHTLKYLVEKHGFKVEKMFFGLTKKNAFEIHFVCL